MKFNKSSPAKSSQLTSRQRYKLAKQRQKTKRKEALAPYKTQVKMKKLDDAAKSAKAKTIARSSAVAASSASTSASTAASVQNSNELAKNREFLQLRADVDKLNDLYHGNVNGINAIDSSKSGGNGNTNPTINENNNSFYSNLWE